MNFKRIVAMMALTCLLFANVNTVVYGEEFGEARIIVTEVGKTEYEQGEEADLNLRVVNKGYATAHDIEYTLEIEDGAPISIVSELSDIFGEDLVTDRGQDLTFRLKVDDDAEAGIYEVTLTGEYYTTSTTSYSDYEETINIIVNETDVPDYFSIELVSDNAVDAGEEFNAEITIKSLTDKYITGVDVTVEGEDTDSIGNYSSSIQTIDVMEVYKEETLTYKFYADEDMETGVYSLDVLLEFDVNNVDYTETYEIFFMVTEIDDDEEELDENIIIKSITTSKSSVVPYQKFNITVEVMNSGEYDSEDITISLTQDEEVIPVSQSVVVISELLAGETTEAVFEMQATDSATTANYPIEVTVEYVDEAEDEDDDDAEDEDESHSQYTGIYVVNDDDDDDETTTPRLIVDSFTIDSDKIFVGDTFNVTMSVKNTSSTKDVSNIKMTLAALSGDESTTDLLTVNQSNSVFIDELDTKESMEFTVPLKVLASADGQIYSLQVDFEFEDEDFEQYEDTDTLNVPVYEKPEITVSDVRLGTESTSSYTIELDFYNTGKVDISNLMVDIEGDFTTNNSNYYVGDFSTGRMDVYDVEIQGSFTDAISGTIIFTYDDTFGEEVSYEKEFTLDSSAESGSSGGGTRGQMPDLENMSEEELAEMESKRAGMQGGEVPAMATEDSGIVATATSNPIFIAIPAVIIIAAIVAGVVIFKRKKANKG